MSSVRPARGKAAPAPARPLHASSTAASRAKQDKPSAKSSTSSTAPPRTLNSSNASGLKVSKATTTQPSQSRTGAPPSTRVGSSATVKGTLPAAASSALHPSNAPKASHPAQSDTLQIAAQSCAWAYMTCSLEGRLSRASEAAQTALRVRKEELDAEEVDIAESRVRFEAERLIDFYDELNDRKVAEEVAAMIIRFKTLERRLGETTSAALRVTSLPLDDTTHISQYTDVLDTIGSVEDECRNVDVLVSSLIDLTSSGSGRLLPIFQSLSVILQGHLENVVCMRDLVQCCRENYRMGIGTLTLV